MSFAGSTTFIYTIYLDCSKCKRPMLHAHAIEPDIYRCTKCDTLRKKEDDHVRPEVLPTASDSSNDIAGEGDAHILGYCLDGNRGAVPVRDFRTQLVKR
jgi:DNA-directed RNA polymerase subunit M/transcription elongation factor TFIIS